MLKDKCNYCLIEKATINLEKYSFCKKCYSNLCLFCSDREGSPITIERCSGHSFSSSTKNRFMEDSTFIKGGGFDLES